MLYHEVWYFELVWSYQILHYCQGDLDLTSLWLRLDLTCKLRTYACINHCRLKKFNPSSIARFSSIVTIFGPPANKLFGPLAKGLRQLLLPGGPLVSPFSPAGPRGRGACGALATPMARFLDPVIKLNLTLIGIHHLILFVKISDFENCFLCNTVARNLTPPNFIEIFVYLLVKL